MIKFIKNIKNLLKDSTREEISEGHTILTEKREKANMEVKVDLENLSGIWLKIRAKEGKEQQFHPAIVADRKGEGYKKSCDYLIIVPSRSVMDVYFIELKTKINGKEDREFEKARTQIIHTVPVWDYLVSMVENHFGKKKPKINQHFAIIADTTQTGKKTIRQPKCYKDKKNRNFKLAYSTGRLLLESLKCPTPS